MKKSTEMMAWIAAVGVAALSGIVALTVFAAMRRGTCAITCVPCETRRTRPEPRPPAPGLCPPAGSEAQQPPARDEIPFARSRADSGPGELSIDRLDELAASGDPETEKEALRKLMQLGSDRAHALALGRILSLETTDPRFRDYLEVLAHANNGRLSAWLVEELGRTAHQDMRRRILAALSCLAGPTITTDLILALEAGTGTDLLHAADCADLLVQQASPGQVGVLKEAFLYTESAETRRLVAAALANIGNTEAVLFLVTQATAATPRAADGLAVIPTIRSVHAQETLLVTAMNRAYPVELRTAAVAALAHQPGSRVVTVLENLVRDEQSQVVRAAIQHSLVALAASPALGESETVAVSGPQDESWYRESTGL